MKSQVQALVKVVYMDFANIMGNHSPDKVGPKVNVVMTKSDRVEKSS